MCTCSQVQNCSCARLGRQVSDTVEQKNLTIGFRGTEDYREALQREALARGIKVQPMLEAAVDLYLKLTPAKKHAAPEVPKNLLAGLDPEQRADAEAYIELLRSGVTLSNIHCPKEYRAAVLKFIQLVSGISKQPKIKKAILDALDTF